MKTIFLKLAYLSFAITAELSFACEANFTSEVSAREFMGEHTVSQEIVSFQFNGDGSGVLDHIGLASCKFDTEWHCIKGAGLYLHIPRKNDGNNWEHEGFRYVKQQSELVLFNKKQSINMITAYPLDVEPVAGTLAPQGIYLFNKKMDLIGYTIKMIADPETRASSFFTFYLHDGKMPLSCY